MTGNRYVSDAQRAWLIKSGHGGRDMTVRLCDTIDAMLDAIDRLVGENGWIEDHEDGSIDEHEDAYCGYCHAANLAAQIRGK